MASPQKMKKVGRDRYWDGGITDNTKVLTPLLDADRQHRIKKSPA